MFKRHLLANYRHNPTLGVQDSHLLQSNYKVIEYIAERAEFPPFLLK